MGINANNQVFVSNHNGWMGRDKPGTPNLAEYSLSTTRYIPDRDAPETKIFHFEKSVSVEGNTVITWSGRDLWRETPDDRLE